MYLPRCDDARTGKHFQPIHLALQLQTIFECGGALPGT
jgi:hypothetical protein